MTEPEVQKTVEISIIQDLTNGELKVTSKGQRLSFPIAIRMVLASLRGLKQNIINNLAALDDPAKAFPNQFLPEEFKSLTKEEAMKQILRRAEGEMYDLFNLAASDFLDTVFPLVNEKPSLTEQAAAAAGLDSKATPEELLEAENKFIEDNPELAAQTQELELKKIAKVHIDKDGKPTAHPNNPAGGLNRATRRKLSKE